MSKQQEHIKAAQQAVEQITAALGSPKCDAVFAMMVVQAIDRVAAAVTENTRAIRDVGNAPLRGDDDDTESDDDEFN